MGQTGNQSGLDDYAYLQKYNTNYYDWTDSKYVDATPTVGSRSNLKNEDLTWETTTQTNVGIDLTVLKGRLTVSLDALLQIYEGHAHERTSAVAQPVDLPQRG